jgi:Ni,Fe-hydrogenase maturation factor
MTTAEGSIIYEPKGIDDLAKFLKANKEIYHEIWVVLIKKASANPQPVSFSEAVAEAIAQGLVDSRTKTLDDIRYAVRFTKRKVKKA